MIKLATRCARRVVPFATHCTTLVRAAYHPFRPQSCSIRGASSLPLSPSPLPAASCVDVDGKCLIEYIDVKPVNVSAATPTLVLIHGTPGTYRDFRHLVPLLQDRGVRVVGVNVPGSAGSTILDTPNYYEHMSMLPSTQLTLKAMQSVLKDADNVFLLGHSFGSHTAVHFTALNQDEAKIKIKGLVFVAGAGHCPHRAVNPRLNALVLQSLRSNVPLLEPLTKWFVRHLFLKRYHFPDCKFPDYFTAGLVRCTTANYQLFATHLQQSHALPSFFAWAQNDVFLEEAIVLHASAACHPGPRLAFEKGGHNLQKTRATILADKLTNWITDVIAKKEQQDAHVELYR